MIDSINYVGDRLDALDLRFGQNCAEATVASVRGQMSWRSDDTTRPPGPVTPPPASLWRPAAGVTPSSGSYLYTQSEQGDFLGSGQSSLTTPATKAIQVTPRDLGVDITAGDVLTGWSGHFEPMSSLTRLEPGYYARLKGYPSQFNPARGGISWSGQGHGCNDSSGWFVVDSVSYEGSAIRRCKRALRCTATGHQGRFAARSAGADDTLTAVSAAPHGGYHCSGNRCECWTAVICPLLGSERQLRLRRDCHGHGSYFSLAQVCHLALQPPMESTT